MTDFLTQSSCRGMWPRKVRTSEFHHRSECVSRLMRERRVPRFIIAPDGMGKSVLACEYAETVFSFEHVFWIDCRSPCFLRDLDEGGLAGGILAKDDHARLVVFDGLYLLDEGRADAFAEVVEQLLGKSCEVIATLAPSADVYGRLFHDRLCLDARDLLISEAEREMAQAAARGMGGYGNRHVPPGADCTDFSWRIASIAWGEDGGTAVLAGILREELLAEVTAWMFVAFIVRSGSLVNYPLFPSLQTEDLEDIAQQYPFFGLNVAEGDFSVVAIDVDSIVKAFSPRFADIARALQYDDAEEMHNALATCLVGQGRSAEACRYICLAGTRAAKERWLAENGRELFLGGILSPTCSLFDSVRPKRSNAGFEVCMVHAWSLLAFGEGEEACQLAARVVASPYARDDTRIFAALLISVHGGAEERAKANASLCKLLGFGRGACTYFGTLGVPSGSAWNGYGRAYGRTYGQAKGQAQGSSRVQAPTFEELCDACVGDMDSAASKERLLAVFRLVQRAFPHRAGELWDVWKSEGVPEDVLLVAVTWMVLDDKDVPRGERGEFVRSALQRRFSHDGFDMVAFSLVASLDGLSEEGDDVDLPALLGDEVARSYARDRATLVRQQHEFWRTRKEEALSAKNELRGALRSNFGVAPVKPEASHTDIPMLRVQMFGSMEVHIGEQLIEDAAFRRTKSRTMLALLVLAEGREVQAETLMEQMWPSANAVCSRRSLYTVWNQLKKTLTLPDGSCPYVTRRQGGYRVEKRYLTSDVSRANELYRNVMFHRERLYDSRELLSEFYEVFSGKLMPSEVENEAIVRMRDDYQKRFVDALLSMAATLRREGKFDDALCYATCAFEADRMREDVYLELMHAQFETGQRVQAMKTYMECRDYLSEELGIDPSEDVKRLYLSLLRDDHELS